MNKLSFLFSIATMVLTVNSTTAQSLDRGAMVQFSVASGPEGAAFYVPSYKPATKVLIVFHEWWGLNDYARKEAVHWQKLLNDSTLEVYAIDLYDGKVAVTLEEAGSLMSNLDQQRAVNLIQALLRRIGPNKKIVTLGWGMGGNWAFTGAVQAGAEAVGCVMYYGFPEKNPNKIKPLRCDVLYIRGSQDIYIKQTEVEDFEKKVTVTGQGFTMNIFDAVHAFANPGTPKYDPKATGEAQKMVLQFLQGKLMP
jgi:carboxymethylenebutenolidase